MSILLQVGVKIFLKNLQGRYLVLERSPAQYPDIKNNWDIPGGRIAPGTSLLVNLGREVSEETKLKIIGNPILVAAQDIIRGTENHIVRLTFVGRTKGEPVLDSEHISYKWLTVSEMLKLDRFDEFSCEILLHSNLRRKVKSGKE